MNKLTVKKSSELSLKKTENLLDVTSKILTPRNNIAVVDDSWMERLWAWADENDIDGLTLPRDKSGVINLEYLGLGGRNLTELPKEIVNLTNLGSLKVDPACTLSIEQEVWVRNLKQLWESQRSVIYDDDNNCPF